MTDADKTPAAAQGEAPPPSVPALKCERCGEPPETHTSAYWCDNQSFRADPPPEQAQPAVPALADERAELVAAWNDLPDSMRCHPGLKRLFRACQAIPSATRKDSHG
jgi:hypothetical protein